jgi:hypothetical protein
LKNQLVKTTAAELHRDLVAKENGTWVGAFKDGKYCSVREAWRRGLNERKYRHCLTLSLGNGLSVSERHTRDRLKYIALKLKRQIWGNDHRDQRKIEFLVFKHSEANSKHRKKQDRETGSRDWSETLQQQLVEKHHQALRSAKGNKISSHEHYHALMYVRGNHGWSDRKLADTITEIERTRAKRDWEKDIHLNYDFSNGNSFHGYLAREAAQEEHVIGSMYRNGKLVDLITQRDKWFEIVL